MCCEILIVAARQPCDRGSSSGKDDDQEWAAVMSRIIQSAICLCAALLWVLVQPRDRPGFGELFS